MGEGKVIYVIESDAEFSKYVCALIGSAGWGEVQAFHDGVKGLEACLKKPPACLVLELTLPLLRGEEICRIMRSSEHVHHLPIIVVSELADAQRREMELLNIGADAYFEKPLREEEFLRTLKELLMRESAAPGPRWPGSAPGSGEQDEKESSQFHGYEILEMVGGGGMGTVYKAKQLSLGRIVALKVLSPHLHSNRILAQRFEREAKIIAQLSHPNIVQIYDFGESHYGFFFVMEFVDGATLSQAIKGAQLSIPESISIIKQTADALTYLHSKGIVHRDVKPSNIIISQDGIVKLTDFGISRAHLPEEASDQAEWQVVMGTPHFTAPEVLQGKRATELSDQFSFGLTAWCLFSRQHPKQASTPLKQFRSDLPEDLSQVLATCMHHDPAGRFPSVKAACDGILEACGITSPTQIYFPEWLVAGAEDLSAIPTVIAEEKASAAGKKAQLPVQAAAGLPAVRRRAESSRLVKTATLTAMVVFTVAIGLFAVLSHFNRVSHSSAAEQGADGEANPFAAAAAGAAVTTPGPVSGEMAVTPVSSPSPSPLDLSDRITRLAGIEESWVGRRVTVRARVAILYPSQGEGEPTIAAVTDETATVDVVFVSEVANQLTGRKELRLGKMCQFTGTVIGRSSGVALEIRDIADVSTSF